MPEIEPSFWSKIASQWYKKNNKQMTTGTKNTISNENITDIILTDLDDLTKPGL